MNLLLFLFAIPFAVIIFSIVLQKLVNSPILVAFATFSVFIILALTVFGESFFIFSVVYAIISYVAAVLTRIIGNFIERCCNNGHQGNCGIIETINSNNDLNLSVESNNNNYCDCERKEMIIDKRNVNKKCWR